MTSVRRSAPIRRTRMLCSVVLLAILLGASTSRAFDSEARLAEGAAAYQSALVEPSRDARLAGFDRARRLFASLVESGIETPSLYVNLGNAALQSEDRGTAILAYRRALALDPDQLAARQNLESVRAELPAWLPRPETETGFGGFLDERSWPRSARSRMAALVFLAAAFAWALAVRRPAGPWRALALIGGVLWILLLGSLLAGGQGAGAAEAVVTADAVAARTADSSLATRALPEPLPAGTEVAWLEARGDWARIRLANGRDVWVRSSALTRIEEP